MLPSFATETLAIYYPRVIIARGSTQYVAQVDTTDMIHVSGCSVQPATTSESISEPRDQTLNLMTAWIPEHEWARVVAGGPIHELVVEWRGLQFMMYGDAMPWVSPTGALSHVQIYLRSWRG